MNRKIENLCTGNYNSPNHSKENIVLNENLKSVFSNFEIDGLLSYEAFCDFNAIDGEEYCLTPIEKKSVYERIVQLLGDKIVDEQKCRKQTERQISMLKKQNKRQVEV